MISVAQTENMLEICSLKTLKNWIDYAGHNWLRVTAYIYDCSHRLSSGHLYFRITFKQTESESGYLSYVHITAIDCIMFMMEKKELAFSDLVC